MPSDSSRVVMIDPDPGKSASRTAVLPKNIPAVHAIRNKTPRIDVETVNTTSTPMGIAPAIAATMMSAVAPAMAETPMTANPRNGEAQSRCVAGPGGHP